MKNIPITIKLRLLCLMNSLILILLWGRHVLGNDPQKLHFQLSWRWLSALTISYLGLMTLPWIIKWLSHSQFNWIKVLSDLTLGWFVYSGLFLNRLLFLYKVHIDCLENAQNYKQVIGNQPTATYGYQVIMLKVLAQLISKQSQNTLMINV